MPQSRKVILSEEEFQVLLAYLDNPGNLNPGYRVWSLFCQSAGKFKEAQVVMLTESETPAQKEEGHA